MDNIVVLTILTLATAGGIVACNTSMLPEFHRQYGEVRFGTCLAIGSVVSGASMLLLQYIDSWLYDNQLKKEGRTDNVCIGKDCFFYTFILHTILILIAVFCNATYIFRKRKQM